MAAKVKCCRNIGYDVSVRKQLFCKHWFCVGLWRITGRDVRQCPVCKKGLMHKTEELPRIRSPNNDLPSLLLSKLP